ncbi:MAG TPA: hypothetical protein VIW23_09485 [Candidatus Acidoferrum sp.]|jgi:hypothetical protein
MICPQCKAEYRQGFTVCADCGVPLVESAELARAGGGGEYESAAAPGDPEEDPFCSFWKGTDLRVCTEICTVLDEGGIPHKTIRRQDHLFNLSNQSPYEVGVPASLYHKAELAIKEAFGTNDETGDDSVPLLPAPDREPGDFEKGLRDAIADANEWLGPYYPEDATVEVWSDRDQAVREMIEMSLKENNIMTRCEEESGEAKLLVLPEDETRAREIVREIVEGTPLE